MLRTSRERAEGYRAWKAKRKTSVVPVGVLAPGLRARKATAAQRAAVQKTLQQNTEQVAQLSVEEMRLMMPILDKAKNEISQQMRSWIERTPDGALRWSAQKYRNALLQINRTQINIGDKLELRVDSGIKASQDLAVGHLIDEVAQFSDIFDGTVTTLPLNAAKLVATGESYRIGRVANSAARYAGAIGKDIQKRLATDILRGAPVYETIKRLRQDGGPKGLVALEGAVGEKSAIVELIPEGLFARYAHFASRIVRTEISSAYGQQSLNGIRDASRIVEGLQKRWCADGGGCPEICGPMDGVTVDIDEDFQTSIGPVDSTPAHPNCGCRTGAWKDSWADILTF